VYTTIANNIQNYNKRIDINSKSKKKLKTILLQIILKITIKELT